MVCHVATFSAHLASEPIHMGKGTAMSRWNLALSIIVDNFVERWRIWNNPEYAGVRILSLDG